MKTIPPSKAAERDHWTISAWNRLLFYYFKAPVSLVEVYGLKSDWGRWNNLQVRKEEKHSLSNSDSAKSDQKYLWIPKHPWHPCFLHPCIIKENLRGFSSKSKLYKVVFGILSIEEFYKISGQSHHYHGSWYCNKVHRNFWMTCIIIKNKNIFKNCFGLHKNHEFAHEHALYL